MSGILVFFHCPSNTGYAIGHHEYIFALAALKTVRDVDQVHFAYPSIADGRSPSIPKEIKHIIQFDPKTNDIDELAYIEKYIVENNITVALGFDQPVHRRVFKVMRQAGIKWLVSYWGAPMSTLNSPLILILKRLDVLRRRYRPNLFVFQSEGMRKTAYQGRGIAKSQTRVVYTGIDTDCFCPNDENDGFVNHNFGIPHDQKIVYYSGHIDKRKGVDTLLRSAAFLINECKRRDVHFLLFGNKSGEEKAFEYIYTDTTAANHITFGGYRNDLMKIIPCCYLGVLATNEWDSFPVSTIEISSCGLPLIVSNLLGVNETAIDGETGFHFAPGDYRELAAKISYLLDRPNERDRMGTLARSRVLRQHKRQQQIDALAECLVSVDE